MSGEEWLVANQRLIVAEFARIAAQIGGSDISGPAGAVETARAAMPGKSAIDMVADAFALTPFERDVLLLCAGVEMDGALADHCHTDGVSFGLALSSLAEPHWSAVTPVRPLRRWQLVEMLEGSSLCTSRLRIDERVLHFLAGINYLDTRLRTWIRVQEVAAPLGAQQTRVVESAVRGLQSKTGEPVVIQLHGSDPSSQREVARSIAERLGLVLYRFAGSELPANASDAQALARLWTRESLLLGAAICIDTQSADPVRISGFTREPGSLVFVMGEQPIVLGSAELRFQVDVPAVDEQKALWKQALGDHARLLNGSLDVVASRFRVGTDVMARAADVLRQSPGDPTSVESIVLQSCRDSIRRRMEGLAERIEPIATWDDLVLPESQLATLREIGAHVRRRRTVYEDWGFGRNCSRGLGISALFAGESGTGKTMAAEVLANELKVDLYRIDLASMVSKYIGETEKNLRKVFDAAEDGAAILLFDEADALFGKRSEVNDSHDRYANIEVSYLLQRMESYRGLAILTTNLKSALDTAFQRRLRFVVQFPFPDSRLRERIWRHVFPASTPTAGLDHARLAQLNASGGSIRNIAMNAAFLAADSESPIGMAHLLKAARSEAAKRERPYSDAETRGWA